MISHAIIAYLCIYAHNGGQNPLSSEPIGSGQELFRGELGFQCYY